MDQDYDKLAAPLPVRLPIETFLRLPPFPGHRDSTARAHTQRADHLKTLSPDHVRCEGGMVFPGGHFPDDLRDSISLLAFIEADPSRLMTFTGNTRKEVYGSGLAESRPSHMLVDVYPCESLDSLNRLGTHFDSRKATWSGADHQYSAFSTVFGSKWKPQSKQGKNGGLGAAVRLADAYERGVVQPVTVDEAPIEKWQIEVQLLDELCCLPLAESAEDLSPYRAGILASVLLCLRYEDTAIVREWWSYMLMDQGTKTSNGIDGVQFLTEVCKRKPGKAGRSSAPQSTELARKTLAAFLYYRDGHRTKNFGNTRVDPIQYCQRRKAGHQYAVRRATEEETLAIS